jgi:hypothetical protein
MSDETKAVRPLDSSEIKDVIAQHCAEKIREALNSTCWLYGSAWPKFRVDPSRINITLANMYGEEREIFVNVNVPAHEVRPGEEPVLVGGPIKDGRELGVDVEIPYTPPDVLRKNHGLPIPTVVKRDDGSTEQKAVVFRRAKARNVEAE